MIISKITVADKIASYLHHDITLEELVHWAEKVLMDEEIDEQHASIISSVIARLGVADVRAFGLSWEDSEDLLRKLGFATHVQIVSA